MCGGEATPTPDLSDWALAEKAAHAREHADALRRLALDDQWERLWWTRIHVNPHGSPFDRYYAAKLDAGMARLDAEREAEGTS
jgi:hypothetical protein